MYWPGADPYWDYNQDDNTAARMTYGVNWVPWMMVDGDNYAEGTGPSWAGVITNHMTYPSDLEILLDGSFNYGTRQGQLEIALIPENGLAGEYQLRVALTEDSLYFEPSYQDYDTHHNVMRALCPGPEGTTVTLSAGDTTWASVPFMAPDPMYPLNMNVVAFVQDTVSLEVFNAAILHFTENWEVDAPFLNLVSQDMSLVGDDGDGKLNPGEGAEFMVEISNDCGWLTAGGLTATLRSSSPFVTITDSMGILGDLDPCATAFNFDDPFAFDVSEEASPTEILPFTVVLTANQDGNTPFETQIDLEIQMDMFQLNFPVGIEAGVTGGSAVLDLDGAVPAHNEVIFTDAAGNVHAVNRYGNELTGFPVALGDQVSSSPAIGDLDGDGSPEIVVTGYDDQIHVIHADGSHTSIYTAAGNLQASPGLYDLDGDGDLEIIAPGYANELIVVQADGTPFGNFPISLPGERMLKAAAVTRINEDAIPVIVVATLGGKVHAFLSDGSEYPGFPVSLGAGTVSAVTLADLDLNGQLEILVGCDDRGLYDINFDGLVNWSFDNGIAPVRSSPAVADITADEGLEVAFVSMDAMVHVVTAAGTEANGWPQSIAPNNSDALSVASVAVTDLDGDGVPEILVGSEENSVYGFHADGTLLDGFPIDVGYAVRGTPTVDDLDQDGNPEIIIGSEGSLVAVDVKSTPGEAGWFTDQGDYQRTGTAPTGVTSRDAPPQLPETLRLEPAYPNPFNPSTHIRLGLPESGPVELAVFDIRGRQVASLLQGWQSAGWLELEWTPTRSKGESLAGGIYTLRLEAGSLTRLQKVLYLK